jgi:hypothetical protein
VALSGLAALSASACVAVAPPGGAAGSRGGASEEADAGGTGTASGASSCDVACPTLDCPDGMHPAPLSGECCPTNCEPDDCSLVDCPPLDCASGSHSTKPRGSCCSVCSGNPAPLPGDTCEEGQQGYDSYYSQLTASLGAMNCMDDGDCRVVVIDNPCSHGCGTAVAARLQ